MKILVTGGAGFLGAHLCRALVSAGHEIRVLDLVPCQDFESMVGDVLDAETCRKALQGVEAVFHLASFIEAGESVKEPYKFTQNNVLGTVVLLEEMRKAKVKTIIFSSSAAVYGEPTRVPIFEDDRTLPINPYGMTKLAMEALVSSYVNAHGFTGVALRYFNLYGPGEAHVPETHAIPRFISQIKNDQTVTVWGSGEHQRDYVYIQDIVEAHVKSLSLPAGKFHYMNLSGKNATSVAQIITYLEKIMHKKAKIEHLDSRPGDPLLLFADGSKAKEMLDWEARTSLETGLQKTVAWFESAKV